MKLQSYLRSSIYQGVKNKSSVQVNIGKALSVPNSDTYNNFQTSDLKYGHVHKLYVFVHPFTSTQQFSSLVRVTKLGES